MVRINIHLVEIESSDTNPEWHGLLDHIILSPAAGAHYVPGSVTVPQPYGDGPFGPSDHYPVLLELAFL